MDLTLQADEAQLLHQILTITLGNLRMEIAGTDAYDLRQQLKQDEIVIKALIAQLEQASPIAAPSVAPDDIASRQMAPGPGRGG